LKQLKARKRADVTGLDFSNWACEQLIHQGFNAIVSYLPKIPFPDRVFDVAVATEVLEHLDDPEETLKQMARVVKPGGLVMVSVPDDALHPHEEFEHQQSFTRERLGELLATISPSVDLRNWRHGPTQSIFACARI